MSDITKQLEEQADLLFRNVAGWETKTLVRIGGWIKGVGEITPAQVKSINNAATVKSGLKAITKELAKITGENISIIEQIYNNVIEEQHLESKYLYDYRNKKFIPFRDNKTLQAMTRAWAKTTAGTMLNLSKTKALGFVDGNGAFMPFEKSMRKTLDKAVMAVASGSESFNVAMRDVIQDLGGSGLRVNYGGGITRRLDTVVRQSVLYGAKQVSVEYNEMIGEELGCDGIEIDWHTFPRPSHEFMQGKQYSLDGKKRINGVTYESADDALSALEDYGCLHFKTPIICGVSEPRYDKDELKRLNAENKKPIEIDGKSKSGYALKQNMRKLETEVRKQSDIRAMAKASGDKELVKQCDDRIAVAQERYNVISDATGIKAQPQRMASIRKTIDKSIESDIIKAERSISSRNMANGMRKPPNYILNQSHIEALREDIKAIGADESVFKFNIGRRTGYDDVLDEIRIRGDILPDQTSQHPRDLMSSRAALAHEYYGHRAYRGTKLEKGSWNDEFRASYMAAKNAPNLSDQDRRYLILDALERAKEKGVAIKHNDFIRRILYGY